MSETFTHSSVTVTLVQIGLGNPGGDLLPGPIQDVGHTPHRSTLAQPLTPADGPYRVCRAERAVRGW